MKNQISTIKLRLIIIIVIIVFIFVDRVDKFINNTEFLKTVIIIVMKNQINIIIKKPIIINIC